MIVASEYSIKPYHWWITLGFAIAVHSLILFNYDHNQHQASLGEDNNNELIVSLKKLRNPAQLPVEIPKSPQQPVVEKKVVIEKPKPLIKKPEPVKPKITKRPVAKTEKAVIQTPVVESFNEPQKEISENKTPARVTNPPTQASIDAANKQKQAIMSEKQRYMNQLSAWLNKHKKYPTIARRRGLEGDVTISFTLDKNGRLMSHKIVNASIHKSLNTAAIKMLQKASPMPPIPNLLIDGDTQFEYTIPVSFNLSAY